MTMMMTPFIRKLALLVHIVFSVGWLGAVAAYLALAVLGLTTHDAQMSRAAYLWMEPIGWFVILPFCLGALLSGLVQSLGTRWGLFRHRWVVAKFLLTIGAIVILLRHLQELTRASAMANANSWTAASFRPELIHAGGGLLVLLAAATLSVFKPWGMTPWAQSQTSSGRAFSKPTSAQLACGPIPAAIRIRWVAVFGVHALLFALLFVIFHVTGVHHH